MPTFQKRSHGQCPQGRYGSFSANSRLLANVYFGESYLTDRPWYVFWSDQGKMNDR